MSSNILRKKPPSSWTDLYCNSLEVVNEIAGGTGSFEHINADSANITILDAQQITATTGTIGHIEGNTSKYNNIDKRVVGTAININGAISSPGDDDADLPMFSFRSGKTQGTGTSVCYISDETTGFSFQTASILRLDAPNSVSLGNGTNFIRCTNLAAQGVTAGTGTYDAEGTVFNVESDGTVQALAYEVLSSKEFKRNIDPINIDSRKLRVIEPAKYQYNQGEKVRIGIMYEDIYKLAPEACNCENKHIDLAGVCGVLFGLVKDLEKRLSELENKVKVL